MAIQTNVKRGLLPLISAEDLTGKELYLVKAQDGGTEVSVLLPTAITDLALYVVDDGAASGSPSTVRPLETGDQLRLKAKGTIAGGAVLVHADPSTAADKGKVRTIPATGGYYFSPGVAEEDATDGGHVRVRILPRIVFVPTAFSGSSPAATASTNTSPYGFSGAAQADAINTSVREMRAALIAAGLMS